MTIEEYIKSDGNINRYLKVFEQFVKDKKFFSQNVQEGLSAQCQDIIEIEYSMKDDFTYT